MTQRELGSKLNFVIASELSLRIGKVKVVYAGTSTIVPSTQGLVTVKVKDLVP